MRAFDQRISKAIQNREEQGLTRTLRNVLAGNQVEIEHDGQRYINFSNNDYLGLANDAELIRHWQAGLSIYGCGSGASPLVTGYCSAHANLEAQLCEWLGYERAVLFNSGFSANQAVLFSLLENGDHLIQDRLNHASLMEAGMLSQATMRRFKHNDLKHLSELLQGNVPSLVVTEGVFSMDGDCSPLIDLSEIVKSQGESMLMVDDAHGIGVLGFDGSGSCKLSGVQPDILVVTFGKALGLSGAAVMCNKSLGNFFTQFAKHHVYSTAMPPAQAYTLSNAVTMVQNQYWRREKLAELQEIYRDNLSYMSNYVDTSTPIKPFLIGDSHEAMQSAERMKDLGVWLTAIRPPTVPQGTARLRITLTAAHTMAHVKSLCSGLRQVKEMLES